MWFQGVRNVFVMHSRLARTRTTGIRSVLQDHKQLLTVTRADAPPIPGNGMTLAVVNSSSMAAFPGFNLAAISALPETRRKEPGHSH